MSKFCNKNREHTFESLGEMISDIINECNENNCVNIIVSVDEVSKFITALFATEKFVPTYVEWGLPEINGYNKEYLISLLCYENDDKQLLDKQLLIDKCWNDNFDGYYNSLAECYDVIFASQDISKELYDIICNENNNVVLFDIKE